MPGEEDRVIRQLWQHSRPPRSNRNHSSALLLEAFDIGNIFFITNHRAGIVRSQVAMITTGNFSSIKAKGPCLVSPVG